MRPLLLSALLLLSSPRADAAVVRRECSAALEGNALDALEAYAVLPVLREGGREGTVQIERAREGSALSLHTPAGDYRIELTDDPTEVYPSTGLPELRVRGGLVEGFLRLERRTIFDDPETVEGLVRSMARADAYFHPQSRRPNRAAEPSRPTRLQARALEALVAMESRAGRRRGLLMPTGTGKTVVAAKYAATLGETLAARRRKGWKKTPRVLFVVQNVPVLDDAVETFKRELRYRNDAKIYGDGRDRWNAAADVVAVTRSSYFSRVKEIHRLLTNDPDQPWLIVFDEGQHLGKRNGEFEAILADLAKVTDHRHRELLLSAFLYHRDRSLVVDHLGGNVVAPLLAKSELDRLRRGKDLVHLARTQFYRAMRAGYLMPLDRIQLVRRVDGKEVRPILEGEMRDKAAGRRQIRWSPKVLDDVAKRLRGTRVPNRWDRGVVFVDSRARADLYAKELAARLKAPVRALHSGEGVDRGTLDWLRESAGEHRYVVVVDMLREGVDVPPINALVLLRSYGPDIAGFGALLQNLGRGTRVDATETGGKVSLRLLDYTLYSRWFRDGLAGITIELRPDDGKAWNGASPFVVVDDQILDPVQFRARYLELFPEDASFLARHALYDETIFRRDVVPLVAAQFTALGLPRFASDYGPKRFVLRLAQALPDSPEKDLLLASLDDDEHWGWNKSDGSMLATGMRGTEHRVFEALHAIAALARLHPVGKDIDLDQLGTPAGIRTLFRALVPAFRPLDDFARARTFLSARDGALERLFEEADRLPVGVKSLESLFRALARRIPEGDPRTAFLARLEAEGPWGDDVERRDRGITDPELRRMLASAKSNKRCFQRVYRVLVALALAYEAAYPDRAAIRIDSLHTRAEASRLIEALTPSTTVAATYDDASVTIFVGEDGGLLEIRDRIELFGMSAITDPYGGREIALAAARWLGEDGDALVETIGDPQAFQWAPSEGFQICANRSSASALRLLRALAAVAQRLAARAGAKTDPTALHTRRGMQTFLDELTLGFALPFFDDARYSEFLDGGGLQKLLDLRARYPVPSFWKDHGVPRVLLRATDTVATHPRFARFRTLLEPDVHNYWGWKPCDADAARRPDRLSLKRALRAALAYAAILAEENGTPCDLESAHHADVLAACLADR